jgi:hypothetical protein
MEKQECIICNHGVTVVSIRKMYNFFVENLYEELRDFVNIADNVSDTRFKPQHTVAIASLIYRDVANIRNLFKEGYAYMLVPFYDPDIQEIRIVDDENDNKLLLVVTGDEISV